MPQFYARYVPTSSDSPSTNPPEATSEKRKRKAEREPRPKNKKQRVNRLQKETGKDHQDTEGSQERLSEQVPPATKEKEKSASVHVGENILSKHGVSAKAAIRKNDLGVHEKAATNSSSANDPREQDGSPTDMEPTPKKKRKKQKDARADDDDDNVSDDSQKRKHSSVLSKFDKAKARMSSAERPSKEAVERTERPEMHGLDPIPQPKLVVLPSEKPSYSTLPAWQANAVKVVHGSSRKFSEFSISETVVSNLKKHGLKESLSVQTTVLPLLLDGPDNHDGDVCVSAATGSGKTLAYVVPMIEALKEYQVTSLRGVIVVPTRELVQQVRQLCEVCAAGTSLKVATAAGNKSLREEQKLLVTEEEVYDPKEYQRQQNAPIDWAAFSLEKVMQDAQKTNTIQSVHFVKQFKSNVDILITTPGRLVDHLRSTEGFNLDHIRWLVVDEADRLLNESYQEWVDVVTPALQSQAATSTRDKVLQYMRLKVPQRVVRKVLLSATMTRDISKLNRLGLQNPKLVILGSAGLDQTVDDGLTVKEIGEDPQPDRDGAFHLPPSLSEYAITIKDGHDKPLFLLQLLQRRILGQATAPSSQKTPAPSSSTDSSPSDESDISTSFSSSSSDTDSDTTTSTSSDSSPPKSNSFLTNPPQPSSTPITKILIFTRSTSSATRLSRLLALLSPTLQLSTLTRSTSTHSTSRRALKSFLSSKNAILIATDRASRGLDIPHLTHVVSYDVPSSALTYVHRVGRTARAGRAGNAWTLVEYREGKWFWGEIGGKGVGKGEEKIVRVGKVKRVEMGLEGEWGGVEGRKRYEDALGRLGEEVRGKA